jgi:hypothetical protein
MRLDDGSSGVNRPPEKSRTLSPNSCFRPALAEGILLQRQMSALLAAILQIAFQDAL